MRNKRSQGLFVTVISTIFLTISAMALQAAEHMQSQTTERGKSLDPSAPILVGVSASAFSWDDVPAIVLEKHRSSSDCEEPGSDNLANIHPSSGALGEDQTLYIVPCSLGAYNVVHRLYRAQTGDYPNVTPLYFAEYVDGYGWQGNDVLINADFDPRTKSLHSFAKGRGLGDCGSIGHWTWKDGLFEMVKFIHQGECNGADVDDWPVIFPN